jgi:hypothetical protein
MDDYLASTTRSSHDRRLLCGLPIREKSSPGSERLQMTISSMFQYFDLASSIGSWPTEHYRGSQDRGNALHWFPQYAALIAGIVGQPYLLRYMSGGVWDLKGFVGWLVASVFIAVMAFPAVYKNSLDPEKPLFVQLCVIFATGMGWQTLVGSALKAQ